MHVELMSDEIIVTDVLSPNSAKYAAGRVPRPNVMAVALRNLQYAVNLCQDVIFFTDSAGMVERVNPAFEELTGYSSVEAVGQDLTWIAADGPKSDSYRQIGSRCSRVEPSAGICQCAPNNGSHVNGCTHRAGARQQRANRQPLVHWQR
jgi:PAS domain-containing protein